MEIIAKIAQVKADLLVMLLDGRIRSEDYHRLLAPLEEVYRLLWQQEQQKNT